MKNLFDKLSLDETEVESKLEKMPEQPGGRRHRRRRLSKKEIFINNMKDFGGKVTADEIGIPVTESKMVLPAGSSARWEKD